jgi:hypothetical protein
MLKRLFSMLTTAAALITLTSVLAQAQSRYNNDTPKFEIGGQFVVQRLSDIVDDTNVGGGGRITYNFTPNIAVEGEMNFFPQDYVLGGTAVTNSYQGLFGVKAGIRGEKAGLFGKMRPGFTRFDRAAPLTTATQFTFDVGGVVELYPLRSTVVRFDIGDTIVDYGTLVTTSSTTHNLQFSVGFGFRF